MSFDYPSQSQVVRANRLAFEQAVRSGEITPWPLLPGIVCMSTTLWYLMLPRSRFFDSSLFKWSVFAALVSYQIYSMAFFSVTPNRLGYCFGVMSCYSILNWLGCVLIHDAKSNFYRVDRRQMVQNGKRRTKYVWQGFPEHSLKERLDWAMDLVVNFRGIGWNWQTLDAPGIPEHIRQDLDPQHLSKANLQPAVSKAGCRRFDDQQECVKQNMQNIMQACVMNSVMTLIAWNDPYFAGFVDSPVPSFMPDFIKQSSRLARGYRIILPGLMMYEGILGIYAAKSLAVVLLGQKLLGFRADAWMQPEVGGPFTNILDRGLSGFWGGWWHQTFRFAFQSAAEGACRVLRLSTRGTLGQIVSCLVVFTLSGAIHASGSKMQYVKSNPFSGTFVFFFSQAFGLITEALWHKLAYRHIKRHIPLPVHRVLCLTWVLWFFMMTAPFGTDDMAVSQLWSFEIPELKIPKLRIPLELEHWVHSNLSSQLFQ